VRFTAEKRLEPMRPGRVATLAHQSAFAFDEFWTSGIWMTIKGAISATVLVLLASCAAEPPAPLALKPEVVKSMERYTKEYVLQPGDQLDVTVFHVPEVSRVVTIRPDGFVSLPVLKEVKAGGMTVPDLDDELTRRYADRLVNPDVTVSVVNPRAAVVYVLGEVPHPGPVPIRDAPTVALAIAASGGTSRGASLDNVAVIRLGDDGFLTGYVVERQNSGETAFFMAMTNMTLQAGDLIIVPESGRSQFVRFVQDFINTPLTGVNQALSPYYEFRILSLITPTQATVTTH
jgi:polysaccharide export outer membrane protein